MKGFYFSNTDVRNTRAHTAQILHTIDAVRDGVRLELVAPKYHTTLDLETIQRRHALPSMPTIVFLRNFGIRHPGTLAFVLFNIPAIIFLLRKKIKKEVDFIYLRSNLFFPLVIFASVLGVPCVYETHRRPLTQGERWRDDFIARRAAGIIIISEHMRKQYVPYKKLLLVSHDAVSLERFFISIEKAEARAQLGWALEEKICLYAGTVSKLKGADYIFAAARLLPQTTFLLVGQVAPEFADVELPRNVRLLGRKEQAQLPPLLRAADVLLLPHPRGEYSQSPMKLFEYMASGTPIIASRLPSICEVLNDANATLVEPESAEALAEGIRNVLSGKHVEGLAARAREDVRAYTWEKRGSAVAEFIRKTIQTQNKKSVILGPL
jgi:glycosyltransferase involved in cell wall biosynthesis